jgi:hypothetical protein
MPWCRGLARRLGSCRSAATALLRCSSFLYVLFLICVSSRRSAVSCQAIPSKAHKAGCVCAPARAAPRPSGARIAMAQCCGFLYAAVRMLFPSPAFTRFRFVSFQARPRTPSGLAACAARSTGRKQGPWWPPPPLPRCARRERRFLQRGARSARRRRPLPCSVPGQPALQRLPIAWMRHRHVCSLSQDLPLQPAPGRGSRLAGRARRWPACAACMCAWGPGRRPRSPPLPGPRSSSTLAAAPIPRSNRCRHRR